MIAGMLQNYGGTDAHERKNMECFMSFLQSCQDADKNPFCRTTLEGHITASAMVVDEKGEHCLLVHHKKLNQWLCPGGHCDGDSDIVAAALREVEEETGITNARITVPVFDLDCHAIPANAREPQHIHYDVCCLALTERNTPLIVSDESHDVRWFTLQEALTAAIDKTRLPRMIGKIKTAFGDL